MKSREVAELERRHAEIVTRMGVINAAHADGNLGTDSDEWTRLDGEAGHLQGQAERRARLDDLDRRAVGAPLSGDDRLDRELGKVGILDAVRAALGDTSEASGRAKEMSQELARRSGRQAEGIFWSMNGSAREERTLTTTTPGGGPGSNIIGTDYRPDLFIDRLRTGTAVRGLGARVLSNLTGNVAIPRRNASVTSGWIAENAALSASDPGFDQVTLSPKHAGAISEWSRNMVLQTSPDVEALARDDMAKILGETLDFAAISGTGASNMPRGILSTSGIGSVAIGTNGGALTLDNVSDLIGAVADANAAGTTLGFLTNTKVRRAAAKLKDTTARPYGLPIVFQGITTAYNNLIPSTGTKGSGTGLSTLVYGDWSDLLIGLWSELDILVNPYESTAYPKGNIQIRAMMTCDIAVRHAASFAAITDILA